MKARKNLEENSHSMTFDNEEPGAVKLNFTLRALTQRGSMIDVPSRG